MTAFNVLFDGMALLARGFGWLDWRMCTFGLFRQLSTEGYDGQRWNLEAMQQDVLGWPESNKDALTTLLATRKLKKEDMWQLADTDPEEFGRYCALDAEAALQGFFELSAATERLGEPGAVLRRYHKDDFLTSVRLLAEQQLRGLAIDVDRLRSYNETLAGAIAAGTLEFLGHPDVGPVVAEYNAQVVAAVRLAEPARFIKSGAESTRWQQWAAKVAAAGAEQHFNPASGKQLAWLFFDKLGLVPTKYTDGGARSVDREVLPFLGPAGKLLSKVKKKQKELSYTEACMAKQRDGVLHPQMKSVGTVTGRLSGGQDDV